MIFRKHHSYSATMPQRMRDSRVFLGWGYLKLFIFPQRWPFGLISLDAPKKWRKVGLFLERGILNSWKYNPSQKYSWQIPNAYTTTWNEINEHWLNSAPYCFQKHTSSDSSPSGPDLPVFQESEGEEANSESTESPCRQALYLGLRLRGSSSPAASGTRLIIVDSNRRPSVP